MCTCVVHFFLFFLTMLQHLTFILGASTVPCYKPPALVAFLLFLKQNLYFMHLKLFKKKNQAPISFISSLECLNFSITDVGYKHFLFISSCNRSACLRSMWDIILTTTKMGFNDIFFRWHFSKLSYLTLIVLTSKNKILSLSMDKNNSL